MTRNQRISFALKEAGITQGQLGERLGKAQEGVSRQINAEKEIDSLNFLLAVAELTSFNLNWITTGAGPEKHGAMLEVNEDPGVYLSGKSIRPVTVTVDKAGNENMIMVPVRAFAGYMKGYGDPHFIEKLPAYSLPNFTDGTYRMFQVDGNSMLQIGGGGLHDGDVVIAKYVEDIFMMRDNRVYVVISKEGVVVKRCFNRLLTEEKVIILNSDNKSGDFPAMILHPHEILEVWELKAFISRQLSFDTDLWKVLTDLQAKQILMEDKLNKIETKTLPK